MAVRKVHAAGAGVAELYGAFVPGTRRWRDGLLTSHLRKTATDESCTTHVLLLDSPLTASTLEYMSPVRLVDR